MIGQCTLWYQFQRPLIAVICGQPNMNWSMTIEERLSHGWFDVPLSKIRSRSVNANAFVIARDQLAQQSGSSLAEEKSWYDVYCMRLQSLFTELVCQLEGFAVAVAVMVIWGILGFVIEWYWNMAIGAMYAGAFLSLFLSPAMFHVYCCEGTPRTSSLWLWISDSSSMLKLKLNQINWTRLEVSTFDCHSLFRLPNLGLQSPFRLIMGTLLLITPWRKRQGSGRRSPPLARGWSSSVLCWRKISAKIQRYLDLSEHLGPELENEPQLCVGSTPKRRRDVASWRCWNKLRAGPGNRHSLATMAIIAGVCIMCIRGVLDAASSTGLQRRVIPQDASIAHLSCLVTRLETLFFEALYPPRVWNTNCGVDEEHWCCVQAALLSESSCSFEYTAESPIEDENKTTGTPPPPWLERLRGFKYHYPIPCTFQSPT